MLKIREYVKAETLQQAYELNQKKGNVILGGMLWLKLQNKNVGTAIDLSGLGLDRIEESTEEFRIGAMVSLRQLEQHESLHQYTNGMVKEALKPIVGIQFRNAATLGGSIFGRFGFSDVLTIFMAMDSYVELYPSGAVPLEQFAAEGARGEILTHIIIKKKPLVVSYLSQRNTKTDFPVLTCAVSKISDGAENGLADRRVRCVIGARPGRAMCIQDTEGILRGGITEGTAAAFGTYIQEQIVTGSNMRAGAAYRNRIAKVLVKRALLAMEEETCRLQ